MVEVDSASASVVTCQTFGAKWPKIVCERQGGVERTAAGDLFPRRAGWNGVYIPLYVARRMPVD
jgi:hypothetical protein